MLYSQGQNLHLVGPREVLDAVQMRKKFLDPSETSIYFLGLVTILTGLSRFHGLNISVEMFMLLFAKTV
jgi:hypothetical protein